MLICSVRGCKLPLSREDKRVVCARGHSFDIARSGYINLLQPQERRSKTPGDTAEAVAARGRLHDSGVTRPLLDAIAQTIAARPSDVVLDAGCGDGFYLANLQRAAGFSGIGIDIAIPAIKAAAHRYPAEAGGCEWIVANADRFIPCQDGSCSVILSITGRTNADEFARVLSDDGRFLVAIPSPEDLIELRGVGRDRVARAIESVASHFTLAGQSRITSKADLDASSVKDVLVSIYRPLRSRPVEAMSVTMSLDLLLFRKSACKASRNASSQRLIEWTSLPDGQ